MESPESWFHRRATCYVEAQVLFHLNQAGVFQALRQSSPCTSAEIAQALDLEPSVTDTLLDYVFGVDDLLERDEAQRYSLSPFGERVLVRYSGGGADTEGSRINMFDVRVGAYGPVWRNLGAMLHRQARYGEDFHRDGGFAESGVTTLSRHFADSVCNAIDHLNAAAALEVGTTTGLLGELSERRPGIALYGVDRKREALDATEDALRARSCDACLIQADFFEVSEWADALPGRAPGLIFSLHFHEMLAQGTERLVTGLRVLRQRLPGWSVLALEQPRLPEDQRDSIQETLWLYGQSNILIHHLIGNGRILGRENWLEIGAQAGCTETSDVPCGYLGYRAFLFQF